MEAAADDSVAYREYYAGERQAGNEALREATGEKIARNAQQDGMRHRGEQQHHSEEENYFEDYDAQCELLTEVYFAHHSDGVQEPAFAHGAVGDDYE